eukprot:m.55210 g.55210  ORF g.55210 m.55210 type:complete len:773 (+) comp16871_c0_seq2:470-2788(+)
MDLRASLPPPGSTNWRSDRAAPGEDDAVTTKVRHVVIREASIRRLPKPFVVYHIDVMTQSDRWTVLRRYSEFSDLCDRMAREYPLIKTAFPKKRVMGNMSAAVIEERRQSLERFLQRLIASDKDVLFSAPLLDFLEVRKHNVVWVTLQLALHLAEDGRSDRILAENRAFHLSATQCQCISRRLKLPVDLKPTIQLGDLEGKVNPQHMANLYDFVHEIHELWIHPPRERYVSPESAQILAIAANISIWRSIRKLRIDHYVLGHFNGLGTIHDELTHFKVEHGMIKSMKEVLLDMVAQKRPAPEARKGVEDWRQAALKSFADNRMIHKPWTRLQLLSLGHNLITEFNPVCLEYLPVLEALELHGNRMATLDTWFRKGPIMPRLRVLDLSDNQISTLEERKGSVDGGRGRLGSAPSTNRARAMSTTSTGSRTSRSVVAPHPSWTSGLSSPSASRSSSVSAQSRSRSPTPQVVSPPRRPAQPPASVLPFGHVVKPTPANTLPPSYNSNHLISTNNPEAPLDELQRLRAERMGDDAAGGENGVDDTFDTSLDEQIAFDTSDSGPATQLLSSEQKEKVQILARCQSVPAAIGGVLDAKQRQAEVNPWGARPVQGVGAPPGSASPKAMSRCLYRLAPALTVLRLAHNQLKSLRGLEHLNVLQTLDVSHNMIGRVSDVSALINMTKLSDLKLEVRSSRACACSVCRVCPCGRMQDLTRVGLFLWFQGNPLASTKGYKLIIVEKYFGSAPPPSILRRASSTEWVCRSPVAHMVCLVAACSV